MGPGQHSSNNRNSPTPRSVPRASASGPVPGRKKGTACLRCRTQKIRCDDQQPACGHCARVGHACVRPGLVPNAGTLSHLSQVEARLRWLEDALREVAPERMDHAPTVSQPIEVGAPISDLAQQAPQGQAARPSPVPLQPQPQDEIVPHQITDQSPHTLGHLVHNVYGSTPDSQTETSPAVSTQIKPNEPLAHEVGLLSLANSKESKYLGPSSGVPFARLIFSAIPQSQGLATCWATPSNAAAQGINAERAKPFPPDWTSEVDLQHFVDAYFETYQPLYPFLDEDVTHGWLQSLFTRHPQAASAFTHHMPRLSEIEASLSPISSVQIFLIIALGSRTLEARLSTDFSSERYFATAMSRLDSLALHDSSEGLQIMLLLTLCSFNFVDGPNAWFLTSNIIASCLDLGFQRRWIETTATMTEQHQRQIETRKTLRSGIFWSAYSLERQLAVVLGRPLTLRDEAIDVEYPGGEQSVPITPSQTEPSQPCVQSPKRTRLQVPAYLVSHYSFRFDRILAEIKLTLYRVVNMPDRFPWPTETPAWQVAVHKSCDALHDELISQLKWQSRRNSSDHGMRSLEIKYHQCLMLLYRPSPAITQPTIDSWRVCYNSAVKTVLICAELQRFCKLNNSWLTAHSVFVSGITFMYCLWINPSLLQEVGIDTFTSNTNACSTVLRYLGKTWSVAADALEKFERLVQTTLDVWRNRGQDHMTEMEVGHSLISMHQSQWQAGAVSDGVNETNVGDLISANEFPSIYNNIDFGSFYTELGDMTTWFDLDWIVQGREFGDYQPSGNM
ncbi:Zn(2)-C6 fungal-type domain-containing protein [Fusarium sp. Ph1]|nr:Zn(2)-C6 fungal-type domain-containing protein [Fusarium sp. Ph1]